MDIPTVEIQNGCDGTLTVSPYSDCASLSLLLLLVLVPVLVLPLVRLLVLLLVLARLLVLLLVLQAINAMSNRSL
jgi:hypothetical protein